MLNLFKVDSFAVFDADDEFSLLSIEEEEDRATFRYISSLKIEFKIQIKECIKVRRLNWSFSASVPCLFLSFQ